MPRSLNSSALMKPLIVLAFPGMYLVYKINEFKRHQQQQSRRKVTERELAQLNHKIDKLLTRLDEHDVEVANTQEEECVICISAKATMQTFPCGHRVVCRKCFVKTIQMAVSQRMLPLRCVICRTKIVRLKQSTSGKATPAIPTPHLANTRACLLRSAESLDPDGFTRTPFLTPKDYHSNSPTPTLKSSGSRTSRLDSWSSKGSDCSRHKHMWKNRVGVEPPKDLNECLRTAESLHEKVKPGAKARLLAQERAAKLTKTTSSTKTTKLSRSASESKAQAKVATTATEKPKPLERSASFSVPQQTCTISVKESDKVEKNNKSLKILPLRSSSVSPIRPPRQESPERTKCSTLPRAGSSKKQNTKSTPNTPTKDPLVLKVASPAPKAEEEDIPLTVFSSSEKSGKNGVTETPVVRVQTVQRHQLPVIPPPVVTLINPNKTNKSRPKSIASVSEELDKISEEETPLLEQTSYNKKRNHRIAPGDFRMPKQFHPPSRFERFRDFHVRRPMPLFAIPEKDEADFFEMKLTSAGIFKEQSVPLLQQDSTGSSPNINNSKERSSAITRTRLSIVASFQQLRSKSPLNAFRVRGRGKTSPLVDVKM